MANYCTIAQKGGTNDTKYYRGVTLVRNLAKNFTSVLNNRLLDWSSANDIKSNAQFGFKPGFGTVDAILALHGMISHHIDKVKKLYLCFIDYNKSF